MLTNVGVTAAAMVFCSIVFLLFPMTAKYMVSSTPAGNTDATIISNNQNYANKQDTLEQRDPHATAVSLGLRQSTPSWNGSISSNSQPRKGNLRHSNSGNSDSMELSTSSLVGNNKHLLLTSGFYGNKNPSKSILIDGSFFSDPPGGVEAMIQLSIAMCQAVADCVNEVFVTRNVYHERYLPIYGDKLVQRTKTVESLLPGDIYIINEGILCQPVPEGVHEFVWLLASYRGCANLDIRFISHNQHLTTFEGLKLPKERVIHPYISPPLVELAMQRAGLTADGVILYEKSAIRSRKENLVLVDNDVPHVVHGVINEAVARIGGKTLYLDNLDRKQIIDAYERAKVMIDWCMRGSERCPLESALFGAIAMSNMCDTGANFADFPVPSDFLIPWSVVDVPTAVPTRQPIGKETKPGKNDKSDVGKSTNIVVGMPVVHHITPAKLQEHLEKTFQHAFNNYWDIMPLYEPLRRSILDHNLPLMTKEATRFLSTVYIADDQLSRSIIEKKKIGTDTTVIAEIGTSISKTSSKNTKSNTYGNTIALKDSTILLPGGCKQC